jgi:hypothetical protein
MVLCRRRGSGGSSSRAVDHGVAAMADSVAGCTATSHQMAKKDESESCASLSSSSWKKGAGQILTEGGESMAAVLSGDVRGWRGKGRNTAGSWGVRGEGAMEDHEAARAHPSYSLVEAERWRSGASSVSLGGTAMVEKTSVFLVLGLVERTRGRMGEGVGGVARGTATEEGPDRRPRPDHGRHGQHAAAHVTSRGMSERESWLVGLLQNLLNFKIIQIRSN